jgi:hypothetical protein
VNYYLLFPFAVIAGLWFTENRIQRVVTFALITGLSLLFVISMAGTKLPHYDAPLFPYLAIITASLLCFLYTAIRTRLNLRRQFFIAGIVAFIITVSLLAKPYSDIIAKVYFPKGDSWEEGFSTSCKFFQAVAKGKEKLLSPKMAYGSSREEYGPVTVLSCYEEELNECGKPLNIVGAEAVRDNDNILIFDGTIRQQLEQRFELHTIERLDKYNLDFVRVTGKN